MAGYFLDNAFGSYLLGTVLSSSSRVAADTGLASGAYPQSGGIIPGTLPAPASQAALTALAGGAKAGATALDYGVNVITVVATAADSVLLPYAWPGALVFVYNADAADASQVFGKGTDTINGVATATGVSQAAGKGAFYVGIGGTGDGSDAGSWARVLTG